MKKIDFLDELLDLIRLTGADPEQYMIEHALFFDEDVVDVAFNEMLDKIQKGKAIPMRSSTKKEIVYKKGNQNYWKSIYQNISDLEVVLDNDGNAKVRSLITKLTGESISQGIDSSITFGKISHIWGEAYNPILFSSLWNIVLVPAYYNDVLDKDDRTPHDFIQRIKELFKAICWTKYDVESKLTKLGLTKQEIDKYEPNVSVLNGITYKLKTIPMNSTGRGENGSPRRHYTINGTGNYSMYDVMGKFAIYRMGKGDTIDDVNVLAKDYTNSSICFFSDDKTKVFRYQLQKKDGSFSDHTNKFNYQDKDYYSTKEMTGKEKGNFTKLMNEINKNFTDFQIVEV